MINKIFYICLKKFGYYFKGSSYHIDESIPLSAMVGLVTRRFSCWIRSLTKGFSLSKKIFIGKKVTLRNSRFIFIGSGVTLANEVLIDGLSKKGVVIGDNVSIGEFTRIEASGTITDIGMGISIGRNSGIGGFSFIGGAGGVSIGEDVIMGQFVSFHPENHNFDDLGYPIRLQGVNRKGISVGDDCWVGAKVTFLDGANVGKGCVIAAGSIVRGDIPDYSIVAGVPAKVIRSRKA